MIWLQSGCRCSVPPYTPSLIASICVVCQCTRDICNRAEAGCTVDMLRLTARPTFQGKRTRVAVSWAKIRQAGMVIVLHRTPRHCSWPALQAEGQVFFLSPVLPTCKTVSQHQLRTSQYFLKCHQ